MNEKSEDCFIYVIGTIRDGNLCAPCKVGISANPNARVWALQTACPNELRLVRAYRVPNRNMALEIEDCFHGTQNDHRLRGEWFNLDPAQAAIILNLQIRWALEAFTNLTKDQLEIIHELAGLNDK